MTDRQKCDEKALTLYYYRELAPEQTRQLEKHLALCNSCQKTLRQIEQALNAIPAQGLQLSHIEQQRFSAQVMDKIQLSWWQRKLVWGSALAASGALALALLILPTGKPPTPIASPAMADIEVLEQLELLQELEILQDLELLEALEDLG